MTSRLAQAGRVCLRCQLRLLSGPRPGCVPQLRPPLTTQYRSTRLYSDDAIWERLMRATEAKGREGIDERDRVRRVREPTDHDEPTSEYPTKPEPSTDRSAKTPRRARDARAQSEHTPEAAQEQPLATIKPRGRRERIGMRRVVLQPESIGIDMLGQRAHTIVMRDDLLAKPRRKIEESPAPEADESAAAEIQAFLEAAEGEPSPEEAHENIEELRPDAGLIQGTEFWELHHELCEGFTNRQLTDYIAKERKKQKGTKKPLAAGASRPRLSWMTTNYTIRPVQKLEVTADMNPKARKALQLMMEQWHLDIWERVEGLSVTDVTVKNPAVAIVLGAGEERNERLATLRAEYLLAGESLTYVPETKLLSIVARRTIIETIINEVDRITNNIGEESVALVAPEVAADKEQLSAVEAVLGQLCRVTNAAYVVEGGSRRSATARIMWVENGLPDEEEKLEKMGHTIWRLLYTAHAKPESTIVVPRAVGGRLDLDTRHEEKLPWMDRQKSWARWVLPVHREGEVAASLLEASAGSVPALAPPEAQALSVEEELWAPLETSISTTFGHVLFEAPQGEATSDEVLASLSSDKPAAHTLTSVVPPPSGLAPLDALLYEDASNTTIVLRFAAGPDHTATPLLTVEEGVVALNPAAETRFTIELHLDVPETVPEDGLLTWDSSPRISARAIFETTQSDVVLPDRPVDLRVTRLASSTLRDPESIPALHDFIDASHLDISTGSLRAPATLTIPAAKLPLAPNENSKPSTTLEFLGLEVRRAAQFPYQGHSLAYSSIEAGLHGGRRAELSLTMAPGADEADEPARRQRYLDLAVSLADSQLVRWGDGPQVKEAHGEEAEFVEDEFGNELEEAKLADVEEGTESKATDARQ